MENKSPSEHPENSLVDSETRFRTFFEQSPLSIQIIDTTGRTLQVNRAWINYLGISDEMVQEFVLKQYNILQDPQLIAKGIVPFIEKAIAGDAVVTPVIHYNPAEIGKAGLTKSSEVSMFPLKNRAGQVSEVVLLHADVTEREQVQSALRMLAETSALMDASLDYKDTLIRVGRIGVQYFGSWCFVYLTSEITGELGTLVQHTVSADIDRFYAALRAHPFQSTDRSGPVRVIRERRSELSPRFFETEKETATHPTAAPIEAFDALQAKSHICVPLLKNGMAFGAIGCVSADRVYNPQDLKLLEELAARAAIALENARLYQEAQKSIRQRDDFISIASHELRTPLTPLKMQVQLLKRSLEGQSAEKLLKPENLLQILSNTDQQIDRMAQLVEDLLDTSRIRSDRLVLNPESFDLSKLVQEGVDHQRADAKKAGCALHSEIESGVVGKWDRSRLEQVVANLLSNAIKYGAGTAIRIELRADSQRVFLTVEDGGIGIAPEDCARIFERFERAASLRKFSGIGLGLYISDQIVRMHGGEIAVESELGKGAKFRVTLPYAV